MNGRSWARPFVWRKKELPTPPKPPGTRKYSSVTRIHFYKEALSTLRNWSGWLGRLADWLIDWLTEKASRQTANFAAYCSKTPVSYLVGEGGGVAHWYYHIQVGSVHFWRFKILNYIFCWEGAGDQKNKYVLRFYDIMIYYVLGGHFYQFGAF